MKFPIDIEPPEEPEIVDVYAGERHWENDILRVTSQENVVIEGTFDIYDTDELLLYVSDNSESYTGSDTGTLTSDGNEFTFTLTTSTDLDEGTNYIFIVVDDGLGNIAQADLITVVRDDTPPTIVLEDSNNVEVNTAREYMKQRFNLVCTDTPADGFGCDNYVCEVTLPDTTCDPLADAANRLDTIDLSETTKICYQTVEKITNKKSDDDSATAGDQAECKTVTIDAVTPTFTLDLTGNKATTSSGGFT